MRRVGTEVVVSGGSGGCCGGVRVLRRHVRKGIAAQLVVDAQTVCRRMLLLHLLVRIAAHAVRSAATSGRSTSARHVRRWRTDARLAGQVLMRLLQLEEGVFGRVDGGGGCGGRLLRIGRLAGRRLLLIAVCSADDGVGRCRRHCRVVIAAEVAVDETVCRTGRRRVGHRRIPPDLMRRRRFQGCGFYFYFCLFTS